VTDGTLERGGRRSQHGFLWAPPIPGPRLARRCAGLPLHSNRNLKQLYHDGFDLSTACSRSCNCHSQLTQNKINALDVDSTLGHSRTRAPNGRALWSSAIGRASSAVKRHWSGPKVKAFSWPKKHLDPDKEIWAERSAIDDSSGPCFDVAAEASTAHLDQRRQQKLGNRCCRCAGSCIQRSARFDGRRREP
jgi:hypothetical protein